MIDEALSWYRQLTDDEQSQIEAAKIDFAVDLARQMSREGLIKRDLAARLGTSAAYATKILRGDANLTLESMVRLARAAGGALHVHIAPRAARALWFDVLAHQPPRVATEPSVQQWARQARISQSGPRHERLSLAA